ncbi:DUF1325-domain-containing protein [Basidiobolus meristosporus CBS 931.73]|uniref:DUF1325-domain-containing protein n=1 Tax=Basidiobolus meristosporus CBS 931.73 TaxID=1314790 RepID=A0A1Y1WQH6_9FUNG|nr:DUF1325-domain-containing protein [Basidiobolus meristosporus CBS 931.73]ORY07958.1 DUF1325-domain-containing protein [Basidiobolus meristosporus CBS 931.73]|eukprot:ORX75548.1 DUF1325-domain-containing protein [Basidiobolus meristosporus CBS 931.73]
MSVNGMSVERKRSGRSRTHEDQEEITIWEKTCRDLGKLEVVQQEGLDIFAQINKLHELVEDEGPIQSLNVNLGRLYREGDENVSREQKYITHALENLGILIALRDNADLELKRKKRKDSSDSVSSLGSLPTFKKAKSNTHVHDNGGIIPKRSYVAAKTPKIKDKSQEWILAVVLQFLPEKNKYQVEDAEVDENGKRMKYNLPLRNIIPLPEEYALDEISEFEVNHVVLALYPNTTCFYKATVVLPPSKISEPEYQGTYRVSFEDDDDVDRFVPIMYVVDMPKSPKQKN